MKKYIFFIFFLFLSSVLCAFWDEDAADKEYDSFNEEKLENALLNQDSYLEYTALVFIRFYQKNISGKSGAQCVFYPSCSRFSFFAINNFGLLEGVILTAGRLQRCHLFAAEGGYKIDYEKNLFVDNVEENIIFSSCSAGKGEK